MKDQNSHGCKTQDQITLHARRPSHYHTLTR